MRVEIRAVAPNRQQVLTGAVTWDRLCELIAQGYEITLLREGEPWNP